MAATPCFTVLECSKMIGTNPLPDRAWYLCIGSQVAPYLSDVFLSSYELAIQENIKDSRFAPIFRFVDDFLNLCTREVDKQNDGCLNTILRCFQQFCIGLTFTHQLTIRKTTKYFNLALELRERHVC